MASLALIAVVLAVYVVFARPYQLNWGATDAERTQPMAGDALNPDPAFLATRAITINGTPDEIWPWLIQMGFGRAGYYGYDILENLGSPRGIHSATGILQEFQDFEVGDPVPISPVAAMEFAAIEPGRYLVWSGLAGGTYGAFTWALQPVDAGHTRLLSRIRWSHHWSEPGLLALDLFTEFTDHIAVRRILQGVKDRVEGRDDSMTAANVEFGIYVIALAVFGAALLFVLIRPLTLRRWMVGLGAGLGWLVSWYGPVPLWMGVLIELPVLWAMFRDRPGPRTQTP